MCVKLLRRFAVVYAVVYATMAFFTGCAEESAENLIASARSYLANGETRAAVIELKRALSKNGGSGEARYLLGEALLDGGDPVAAEVELRKALRVGAPTEQVLPNLARAMLLLGQPAKITAKFASATLDDAQAQAELKTWVAAAYAQQGNLSQANEEIAAVLQANPTYAAAMMVQARLKAGTGDVDGALQLLDAVLANEPDNEHAGVAKGTLLWLSKNDSQGALAAHRKVLATKPGTVLAQAEIVSILFRQGKAAQARQQFEELKKTAPNHPETLFFQAQFDYVEKRYKRSRETIDLLLQGIPNHIRALELAAAAEYHLGNDHQTQAFLARALKVEPGLVLSRQILAQSFLRSGEPARAVAALAPLLKGENADAEGLALAGSAYIQMGDAKKADAAFKKAAQLAPENLKVGTEVALATLHRGRADVALRDLQALAAGDQGPRADLALISAYISQQDFHAALKAVEGLEAKLPGRAIPYQLRGQVLISLRDADGARQSFERALAKDDQYFPAVAALASMNVAAGKPGQARKRVIEFLKTAPNNSQAMMLIADIPTASGAPAADALRWLENAARADPGNPTAHLTLIGRQLRLGDRSAALAAARVAAAALPNDLRIMDALGQAQLLAGEAQQATTTLETLADLQPADAQIQMRLAEARLAVQDFSAAGRALKKAVELDPELGVARRGLAMLALRDKRPQDAMAIAREMQKRQPNSGLGYATEGDIQAQQKNWVAAASAYKSALQRSEASEAAIKLHVVLSAANKTADAKRLAASWEKKRPNDPAFRFHLGDVAMHKRDFAAAEAQYRAVLVNQPNNALAMNNIAWLMLKQSKPGALEMAEKANTLMPNRAPLLDTLAAAQSAANRADAAVQTQRRAVASSPTDPALQLKLARYLIKAGDQPEARQQLKTLRRLGDKFADQAEVAKLLREL